MIARHSLISMLDLSPVDACIQMSSEIPKMTVQVSFLLENDPFRPVELCYFLLKQT